MDREAGIEAVGKAVAPQRTAHTEAAVVIDRAAVEPRCLGEEGIRPGQRPEAVVADVAVDLDERLQAARSEVDIEMGIGNHIVARLHDRIGVGGRLDAVVVEIGTDLHADDIAVDAVAQTGTDRLLVAAVQIAAAPR